MINGLGSRIRRYYHIEIQLRKAVHVLVIMGINRILRTRSYLNNSEDDPKASHKANIDPWDDVAKSLSLRRGFGIAGREEVSLAFGLRLIVSGGR